MWPLLLIMAISSQAQTITSTSAGGNWDNPATWVGGNIPSASNDVVIAGPVRVTTGAQCRNITINSGADLANAYYSYTLRINGNIVNNGRVFNSYYSLTTEVTGNITNNGLWEHSYTKLIGANNHQLVLGAGRIFASDFDSDPGSRAVASSNLHFTRPFNLANGTFDANQSLITLEGNGNIRDGLVINTSQLKLIKGAALSEVGYSGDIQLLGTVRIGVNVTMNGSVTVIDTLTNAYYGYTLTVNGNFVNMGRISNSYYSLTVDVSGNITNHGLWLHSTTRLTGAMGITINQGANRYFESDIIKTGSTSIITSISPLEFRRPFDLGGATLNANAYAITFRGNGNINNGTVINTSSLIVANGAAVANITFVGDIQLKRYVRIANDVVMRGSVTVVDTLANSYYTYTLTVDGSLTNNGLIQNSYYSLTLNITGDVHNDGRWLHSTTNLIESGSRSISQSDGKKFESDIITTGNNSIITALSPLHFTRKFDLGKGVLNANLYRLTFESNGNITNGLVINTRDIKVFSGAVINDVTYQGDIRLHGVASIGQFVTMKGPVTVIDTLQNNYYERTLRVEGNFMNHGLVRNNYYALNLQVLGNVSSTGALNNSVIDMIGSGYRTIDVRGFANKVQSTGENVVLTGTNYISNLTIADTSRTRLASDAVIYLKGKITGRLENNGEIYETYYANRNTTVGYFSNTAKVVSNGGFDSLRIVAMGNQVPATFGNAYRAWWKFETKGGSDQFNVPELTFYYDPALLGRNNESGLEVYHSDDDGVSWRQLSTSLNRTRNANDNWIRITDVPSNGHYLLSSEADPVSVRSSIIMTIIGRTDIRVGPINRYTVHYVNNSAVSTGDFLMRLASEGGVYIESVEPSTPPGITKRSIPIDSLTFDGNKVEAILWVSSMEPHEERTFDVMLRAYPDGVTPKTTIQGDEVQALPLLVIGAWWVAKGLVIAAVTDVTINMCEEVWRPVGPCETVSGVFKEALIESVNKTRERWTGWERPTKVIMEETAKKALNDNGLPGTKLFWAKNALDATGKTINGANRYLKGDFKIKDCDGNEKVVPGDVSNTSKTYQKRTSWDPNEKVGPQGVGAQGFITSAGRMHYQILFENKANAQAPAWRIIITDTLSAAFDAVSVEFGRTSHDGEQYEWKMTRNGNILRWEIEDIELPPNVNPPEGEGYVTFSVMAKTNLPSGTVLSNRADIKFDFNASILTNTVVNTLDFSAPISTMTELATELLGPKITVHWSCDDGDVGSGIESFVLYASKNGGAYTPMGTTDEHWMTVIVDDKSSYDFYVLAKDKVGNVELTKPAVSHTTIVGMVVGLEDETTPYSFSLDQNYPNPFNPITIIPFTLPNAGRTELIVYNLLGQRVATLIDRDLVSGMHTAQWNATHLASGVYLYRLTHNGQRLIGKMLLIK